MVRIPVSIMPGKSGEIRKQKRSKGHGVPRKFPSDSEYVPGVNGRTE